MSVNALSQLTPNPLIVSAALVLYGFLFVGVFFYIRSKFRKAGRVLDTLKTDWASAESMHADLFENAQDRITSLAVEPAAMNSFAPVATPVTANTRNQVTAMGRKGLSVPEIARSCGLPEGEVDVLLSMARMQRAEA